MRELVDRLNQTAYEYYTLSQPTLTDQQWDQMYDQLAAMEQGERDGYCPTRLPIGWARRP